MSTAGLRWVLLLGTYLVACFLCSLWGNEGFMVELGGLIKHIDDRKGEFEKHPHMVIPLLGRFKNESGEKWHLLLAAAKTASGFRLRVWVEILLYVLLLEGRTSGPVFCDEDGVLVSSVAMNKKIILEIIEVKREREDLVLCDMDNIWEVYNIGRSCWRGSQTRTREEGVK